MPTLLFENAPVVAVIDRDLRFVGLNAAFRSVEFGRAYCCDHLDASRPHVGQNARCCGAISYTSSYRCKIARPDELIAIRNGDRA